MMGESYTPPMAKRFNVSIPDALAERLEPHKDKISLSAVMQAALERELAQLTMGDQEKQRRDSFKAAAMSAWLKRNPVYTRVINAFVDNLFDKAINDGLGDIFDFYRNLYLFCRREELEEKITKSFDYFNRFGVGSLGDVAKGANAKWKRKVGCALGQAGFTFEEEIDKELVRFIRNDCKNPAELIDFGPHYPTDETGLPPRGDEFWLALFSPSTYNVILGIMDERIKSMLSEEDIDNLVLNFDDEFVEAEFQGDYANMPDD